MYLRYVADMLKQIFIFCNYQLIQKLSLESLMHGIRTQQSCSSWSTIAHSCTLSCTLQLYLTVVLVTENTRDFLFGAANSNVCVIFILRGGGGGVGLFDKKIEMLARV